MRRKDEHVTYALEQFESHRTNDFDEIMIVHHALGAVNVDKVDITTSIGSIPLEVPFFINAMTGGSRWTQDINAKLAFVAKETGLAMAVGSLSPTLKDPSVWDSYGVVRDINPEGIVFANFNPNYSINQMLMVSEKLKANAIQIHVNVAQEVVMPEGDRHFEHWIETIAQLKKSSPCDIIVKEVGFGMSQKSIETLINNGIKIVDVSGRGGTNFVDIENNRRQGRRMNYLHNWGLSTVQALLESQTQQDYCDIIASGGIRNPLDMLKAYSLGAKACGLSSLILNSVMNDGVEQTITLVESFKEELKLLMAMVGAKTLPDLRKIDLVLSPTLLNYKQQRQL